MTQQIISDEQMDFLNEMMNVAVGSSTNALSQMMNAQVEMLIPEVYLLPPGQLPGFLEDPSLVVIGAKMSMMGDITGSMFFLVPAEDANGLVDTIEQATPGITPRVSEEDLSTFAEITNITVGVFLTAITEFCGLKIYFTIPSVGMDMIQSLVDGSISVDAIESGSLLVIQMGLLMPDSQTRASLLMIPNMDSEAVLSKSLDQARERLIIGQS